MVYSSVFTNASSRPLAKASLMNSGLKKTLPIWLQLALRPATTARTTRIVYWINRER